MLQVFLGRQIDKPSMCCMCAKLLQSCLTLCNPMEPSLPGGILKSRDITLLTHVRIVKAMVFLVAMYGCAGWSRKKAECQRIDAFKLWC